MKNIQSHYFIKFTNEKSINENIDRLSKINYEFNNTLGPRSISKQELIYKFNPLLKLLLIIFLNYLYNIIYHF